MLAGNGRCETPLCGSASAATVIRNKNLSFPIIKLVQPHIKSHLAFSVNDFSFKSKSVPYKSKLFIHRKIFISLITLIPANGSRHDTGARFTRCGHSPPTWVCRYSGDGLVRCQPLFVGFIILVPRMTATETAASLDPL